MLASSATASPSSTSAAAARAIARFALDLEPQSEVEPDLRLAVVEGADAAAHAGDEALLRERREVAADRDLGNRKRFRKFRNMNRIARLEHLQHLLHPLLLGETGEITGRVDARRPYARARRASTAATSSLSKRTRIESRFAIGRGCVQTPRHGRERRTRTPPPARDRDALVGLRQLGHALPRLPVAGRRAHRARAHRRRGARAPAHRLLPLASRCTSRGTRSTTTRSCAAVRRGAGRPHRRDQPEPLRRRTSTGSAASATPTRRSARRRSTHCRECVAIAEEIGSTHRQPLARRRHELSGPGRPARRATRGSSAGLEELYAALPPGMRLLVEYKFFEPGFYSTDLPDWGTAALLCRRLGPQAQVLVDTGHHRAGHERRADRRAPARRGAARRLPLQQPQVRRRRPDRRLDRPVRAVPDHARDRARRRRRERRVHDRPVAQRRGQDRRDAPVGDEHPDGVREGAARRRGAARRGAGARATCSAATAILLEAFETDVRPLLARAAGASSASRRTRWRRSAPAATARRSRASAARRPSRAPTRRRDRALRLRPPRPAGPARRVRRGRTRRLARDARRAARRGHPQLLDLPRRDRRSSATSRPTTWKPRGATSPRRRSAPAGRTRWPSCSRSASRRPAPRRSSRSSASTSSRARRTGSRAPGRRASARRWPDRPRRSPSAADGRSRSGGR